MSGDLVLQRGEVAVVAEGWLLDQLPGCLAGDPFLRRFVGMFQELADGLRSRVAGIEHVVDVGVAPPEFVRWMAGWLAMDPIDPSVPELHQRALVAATGQLLRSRGTVGALRLLLETVTGAPVDVVDSGGVFAAGGWSGPGDDTVRVQVESCGALTERDLVALVRDQLPAHVGLELRVGDRRVFPVVRERPERRGVRPSGSR